MENTDVLDRDGVMAFSLADEMSMNVTETDDGVDFLDELKDIDLLLEDIEDKIAPLAL